MYEDFKIKTDSNISYLTFYTIFKKMNISLAHLGHEECELCETHELHKKNCTCVTLCDISKYVLHRKKYKKARMEYTTDSKSKHSDDEIFTSADLQKVIMLPQMECFKKAIFTRRLTVFNETFAELGSGKRDIAALWHEGISGRQDEDLASTFHSYMLKMRDLKRVVFWLDNCGAQNKNWTLFTMLLHLVNSKIVATEEVELKYLEKGHTFMSADSKHKQIQQEMRNMRKIYDFDDFQTCVKKAKCEVMEMQIDNFQEWKSGMSPYALKKMQNRPYLDKMVHVKFMRGSHLIHYKNSYDNQFEKADFLKSSFDLKEEPTKSKERGIQRTKKDEIMHRLAPLMPQSRHTFWQNLHVNEKVKDLAVDYEKRVSL